jgi:hypothetical protein
VVLASKLPDPEKHFGIFRPGSRRWQETLQPGIFMDDVNPTDTNRSLRSLRPLTFSANTCNGLQRLLRQPQPSEYGDGQSAYRHKPDTYDTASNLATATYPNGLQSLHKYLYAGGDPVNGLDPSGRAVLG